MGSAIKEHIVRTSVLEACSRHGVPHDSALRRQLESEAEIPDGSRDAYVRTSSGVSLDDRIGELKTVPKFAADLPTARPTVQSTDTAAISQNFADIASGKVIVR
jgi:hypothetical protein